ncbi:AlbA family DNA-binding domain-containing protein [Micromonospora sp. LA-10]|uniref:AlbA family DNA-binding domain-containing protein n=1 Tax=Micromonospora sp. LA-10 TaxID=3446364 RepID=UPI003F7212E7
MSETGSTGVADVAGLINSCDAVDVRLALGRGEEGWKVRHGEVTLHAAAAASARTWRYPEAVFLERRIPGAVVAGLVRAEPQDLDGLKVTSPSTQPTCVFNRLPSHVDWRPVTLPWPRTQWEINPSETAYSWQGGLLVGDGPGFITYEAAFSAFFFAAPPSNQASQQPLWRIIQLDRRACLHRVTIAADTLTALVKGTAAQGATLELSTPATRVVRRVGRAGRVRLRLPRGLADSSLLLLRQDEEWLDYRYFASPVPGRPGDASIVWDQPDADLGVLIAGGEGTYVEFKQEIPSTPESRRKVLKTIAAFASGDGGTLLFGVDDAAQPIGLDPTTMDRITVAVGSMIRDSIVPEPPYVLRVAEMNGRTLLLVEVTGGGRWYALNHTKPEFYVRRGASTVPARIDEIAAGFGQQHLVQPW